MTSIILLRYDITGELFMLTNNAIATLKADEHILIDNASTVGEVKDWPDVLIRNKTNLGYPAAVNQGFKLAKGDLIAVANNDIRVSLNWLSVAKEIFAQDPKVGSVHFRMIEYNDPMQMGYNTWIEGKERWCSSSFFVLRREALQPYDEHYKEGGYDDYDYWVRFRGKGWKTAYTTKACYQHKHSATYRAMDDGKMRADRDEKNKQYFISKFGKEPDLLLREKYPEQWEKDYYSFLKEL